MKSSHLDYHINAVVSCVPTHVEHNTELPFDKDTVQKVSNNTGIFQRRIADKDTTAADLCIQAALHLIHQVSIDKTDIGVIVFVTQYPDYILPSTAHIIKERLQLPQECLAIQVNEGCSGYVYGMQLCLSLMQSSNTVYGMLLVGDTTTKVIDSKDTGTRPIFGDAGSATLISKGKDAIHIQLGSDGSGYKDIIVENGSFRLPLEDDSKPSLSMNGMNVFAFGINRVPKYILSFLQDFNTNISDIDFFVMHQANLLMNMRIARKIGISEERVPLSLSHFGNTSNASIPLTITTQLKGKLVKKNRILASGFGVGLSWANALFTIDETTYLDTVDFKTIV